MEVIEKLIELAKSQIGTKETSTGVKYSTEYYGNDSTAAWCVIFQWWLFKHTGIPDLFYDGRKVASCTAFYNWALTKGLVAQTPQRGDIIIFKFGSGSLHMGLCTAWDGYKVTTIDGNTCLVGREADGGQVMERTRSKTYIYKVIRPLYSAGSTGEADSDFTEYTVVKGDSLYKICRAFYGKGSLYRKIMTYNNLTTSTIYPGQVIRLPKEVN